MREPYDTIKHRGCTIKVYPDDNAESPREWSNVGTMACWHRRYNLGDVQPSEDPEAYLRGLVSSETSKQIEYLENCTDNKNYTSAQWDKVNAAIERRIAKLVAEDLASNHIILPLYLYDHSGITMSTSSFSCPWDSGQVGIIHCTMKQARKEWDGTDEEIRKKAIACLVAEVKTYDDHLTGNVYGYVAEDEDGEHIDSCWGFFPDHDCQYSKRNDYMIGEAKSAIDHHIQERANKRRKATLAAKKETAERLHWEQRDLVTV
jgi:hypothetical protein